MKRLAALALSIGLALPPQAGAATEEAPPPIGADAVSFTLDNGLDVVVIPDRRTPVVTHMIWYEVGSADEPEGKTGIAHFLEHLMFKGTATHPAGEFSRVVSELGGEENAFTSSDYTAYYQRVSREHLETAMSYEADRMANLVLTDENVLPERNVVLEERRMRLEGEPGAELGAAMASVLYLRHPYGVPVIGWREDIEKLDRADAIAFYDRFYTPNNAILVVAGDVSVDEVRALAEKIYGKVARRAEPPTRDRLDARVVDKPRFVSHSDPRVQEESVQIAWLVPSYRLAEPGEAEAIDVLSRVLGGGSTSLLYRDLVIERKLAVSVGSWAQTDAYDMGRFGISAVPREGVTLEQLREAIFDTLEKAVDGGLDAESVTRAKDRLIASTIYAQDSQAALARIFGATLAIGGSMDDVRTWPARIAEVSPDAVRQAALRLTPETSVTGYLRRAPGPT